MPKGRWAGLWAHLKSAAFILGETNQYSRVVFPALPGCQGYVSRKVNLTMCWAFSIFLFRLILHLPSLGLVSGWLPFMNNPVDSFASELALANDRYRQAIGGQEAVRCLWCCPSSFPVFPGRRGYTLYEGSSSYQAALL